jgi:hypothetical protein
MPSMSGRDGLVFLAIAVLVMILLVTVLAVGGLEVAVPGRAPGPFGSSVLSHAGSGLWLDLDPAIGGVYPGR